MRIYKHPDKPGWIIAKYKNVQIEIPRDRLPPAPVDALAQLQQLLDNALVVIDLMTGEPIPPPQELESDSELDIDWQAECQERADLEDLEGQAAAQIQWLGDTIPQIDTMTAAQVRSVVKRLAQIILAMLKACRYIIRKLV